VLEAIRQRDEHAAEQAMRDHVSAVEVLVVGADALRKRS